MSVSVIEAVSGALARTRRVLFDPFDLGKWFVLGFAAWLAHLGEGGGFRGNFPSGGGGGRGGRGGGGSPFENEYLWVQENLALVIVGVCALVAIVFVIGLVVLWLQSRGKFMFLDNVARNRAAVVEPWHRLRILGNSLFWFRLVLGLAGLAVAVLIAALGVAIAWHDIQAEKFGPYAIAGIVAGVMLLVPFVLVANLIHSMTEDFVVPAMYLRGVRTLAGWGIAWREVIAAHFWAVVLFYLLKIALGFAAGLLVMAAFCVTCCLLCCLTAIPYLGTVALLPLLVFWRCYSLCFLEQLGGSWRVFTDESIPPLPAA